MFKTSVSKTPKRLCFDKTVVVETTWFAVSNAHQLLKTKVFYKTVFPLLHVSYFSFSMYTTFAKRLLYFIFLIISDIYFI